MSLEVYHRRWDFGLTPEPRGQLARGKDNQYVIIQKHAARRLRYELRLSSTG